MNIKELIKISEKCTVQMLVDATKTKEDYNFVIAYYTKKQKWQNYLAKKYNNGIIDRSFSIPKNIIELYKNLLAKKKTV